GWRNVGSSLGNFRYAFAGFLPADDDLRCRFLYRPGKQKGRTGEPARLAFLIIGGVLLLFAAWNFLVPRPHYSTSTPAPSTVLSTMPDAVSVQFTGALAPESSISVVSTVTVSASGDKVYGDGKRFTATRGADARTLNVGLDSDLP